MNSGFKFSISFSALTWIPICLSVIAWGCNPNHRADGLNPEEELSINISRGSGTQFSYKIIRAHGDTVTIRLSGDSGYIQEISKPLQVEGGESVFAVGKKAIDEMQKMSFAQTENSYRISTIYLGGDQKMIADIDGTSSDVRKGLFDRVYCKKLFEYISEGRPKKYIILAPTGKDMDAFRLN